MDTAKRTKLLSKTCEYIRSHTTGVLVYGRLRRWNGGVNEKPIGRPVAVPLLCDRLQQYVDCCIAVRDQCWSRPAPGFSSGASDRFAWYSLTSFTSADESLSATLNSVVTIGCWPSPICATALEFCFGSLLAITLGKIRVYPHALSGSTICRSTNPTKANYARRAHKV
jgi:hypothetical protein